MAFIIWKTLAAQREVTPRAQELVNGADDSLPSK